MPMRHMTLVLSYVLVVRRTVYMGVRTEKGEEILLSARISISTYVASCLYPYIATYR
jgi:hypothetical protein